MAQRMRKKRHFDERMSATQKWLLARGANGILNMKEAAENYRTKDGARITELDACVPSVSSNGIRRAAKAGEALEGLCAEVADYIITHALYGAEDDR